MKDKIPELKKLLQEWAPQPFILTNYTRLFIKK